MICKNCNTEFQGNYCCNCGQKKVTNRLNLKEIWNTLISSVINYETGFFKTIFLLTINPKKVITDYIVGKRKSYFNPIKLLFIILTIKTFIEIKFLISSSGKQTENDKVITLITENDYYKLFIIIGLIPILSFLSFYFFKKYKYNFAEHILINIYTLSLSSFFVILSYLINLSFKNETSGIIGIIIELLFFTWVYVNLFNKNSFVSIIKAILIMILGYLLFLLPVVTIVKLFE